MLRVTEITDKHTWEQFVLSQQNKNFLHSWNWGEFNRDMGNKIFRFGVSDENGDLAAVFLVVKIVARRGSFLFVPQGPVTHDFNSEILEAVAGHLKQLAGTEKCGFIRVSPIVTNHPDNALLFQEAGFRKAPIHMHAELMWMLDIAQTEEKILKDMRKTTRYSIKKAEREGVKIIKSWRPDDVAVFRGLYQGTARRHHFTAFSDEYLQKEFEAFRADDQLLIFLAEYRETIIAGAMIVFYGGSAFYHHGATSSAHPEIPASYLLQWEAIQEAKARGCALYNFWGIVDKEKTNHPWAGLTLFKKGFGGFAQEYLPAQDLPLTSRYWLSFLVEKIRRARRRL
ncbi:MAG: peptidoglycan bridge formation glycyltransferase FemA/FemB family protein [Candidatus Sungbacteria bacterium]|nr:peptidoglycan bridge formation glycyltransferase FemA/FemB family protein [Candidatus Sungbacteria bacterium]